MSLPIKDVVGILADNLRIRGTVLPISGKVVSKWAKDLNLPKGGATVIYTGHMYQLIPYINCLVSQMEQVENSFLAKLTKLGRLANKIINVSWFTTWVSSKEMQKQYQNLRNIALLLKEAGVEYGFLYADELYSGALVHDLGVDHIFKPHAQKVYEMLKQHEVRKLITVDPHTTNMLRSVYPQYIEDFDIEVKSYLEVLVEEGIEPVNSLDTEVIIHDSCIYSRYEQIIDAPRVLLEKAGTKILEPTHARKLTHCCGGPIESLFPSSALRIGKNRCEELQALGKNVAIMCPLCLANLQRASSNGLCLKDITHYLMQAYFQGEKNGGNGRSQ